MLELRDLLLQENKHFIIIIWTQSCLLLSEMFVRKKLPQHWLNEHGVGVLDWPANSPDLKPIENLWSIVKRKMRNKRPKNADELKATVKET